MPIEEKKTIMKRIEEQCEKEAIVIRPRKDMKRFVEIFLSCVVEELRNGHAVRLNGLGVLDIKTSKARKARNPKTGEQIEVPARKKIVFRASKSLKDSLNETEE